MRLFLLDHEYRRVGQELESYLGILDGRKHQWGQVSGEESVLIRAGVPPDAPMHLLSLPQQVLQQAVLLPIRRIACHAYQHLDQLACNWWCSKQ